MALIDKKVSEAYSGRDIASLSDRPNEDGLTAQDLKARFDQLNKEVIPKYNQLIDLLVALLETGATTNGHTHNMDNLVDGTTNRLFTEVLRLKLATIAENAEVNQNAFSNIKVGATTIGATSKTDTFELVEGLNISMIINPTTKQITLSASGDISTLAVQSILDDIGNYYNSLEVNGALQEIGAILYPSLAKTTPVDADTMLIVDTEASSIYKKITWASIKSAIGSALGSIINALAPKTTPVDNDMVVLMDSASSNGSKKLSWASIKATLKTYFDTLYNNYVHPTGDGNLHVPANSTSNNNKVLKANSTAGSYSWTDLGTVANGLTAKATPIDADSIMIVDSAASNVGKKTTFTQLKAFLKTYFDTVYQGILVSGTNIKSINGSSILGSGNLALENSIQLALSDETTAITTGTGKLTFRMPYACKFTKIPRINVNTASSSGLVTVDIKKNGTTIFSTLLTIDANEKTSVTATTPCVLSSNPTTFADDDEISFDITVAGTGAKGLKATLYIEKV